MKEDFTNPIGVATRDTFSDVTTSLEREPHMSSLLLVSLALRVMSALTLLLLKGILIMVL